MNRVNDWAAGEASPERATEAADGRRFLMIRDDGDVSATRIVVVVPNWTEEVKRAAARLSATN